MKYYLFVLCSFFAVFSCSSCHDGKDPIEPEPQPTHTLLIYIMGDNSLSEYCQTNLRLIQKGLKNAPEKMNLVVYKDNRDGGDALPSLFQLKVSFDEKTKLQNIDTLYIKKWDTELNSCDPKVMKEVVNLAFSHFNTEVKGLEMWSHGMSWLPSPRSKTRYVGQDESSFLEIWDMRQALEGCPHLDYMLFDCCFCGMAELAYELDGVTDFIFAPITEIMGAGFPYDVVVQRLAECVDKAGVGKTLENLVSDMARALFTDINGYTITLLETSQFAQLATCLNELRNAAPKKVENLMANPRYYESQFQHYGRSIVGTRYYFYDFYDYVDYLAEDGSDEVKKIKEKIEGIPAVRAYGHSIEFSESGETVKLSGCKGLGVSVPEFFRMTWDEEKLTRYYGECKWGKALGF